MQMTYGHIAAVLAATIAAAAVLAGLIFGWNIYLDTIGVHRSVRDVAIALWSFLLPPWFTVEEAWFHQKMPQNSTIFVNYSARPDLPGLSRLARSPSSLAPLRSQPIPLGLTQPTIRPYPHPQNGW